MFELTYSKRLMANKFEELLATGEKFYIYGAKRYAEEVYNIACSYGVEILGFCVDKGYYKPNMTLFGKNIFLADEILSNSDNAIIIGFSESYGFVNSVGANRCKIFNIPLYTFDDDFYKSNKSKFDNVRQIFKDEKSLETYDAFLNFKLSGDFSVLAKQYEPNQYFPSFLTLLPDEVFVDGGGYIGDTTEEFIKQANGQYKHIYIFEPDEINYRSINLQNNVTLIKKGLWDKSTILKFSSIGISSGVDSDGDISIDVASIDDEIKDRVSFIKLDIEGSELQALIGARNTIARYTPKIAVCVYHKPDDMITIPQLIQEIAPGKYDFYLRQHHGKKAEETVLYAMPKNCICN